MRVATAALVLSLLVGCSSSDPKPEATGAAPKDAPAATAPPAKSSEPAHAGSAHAAPAAHDHGAPEASASAQAAATPAPKAAPHEGTSIDFPGSAGKASGYLALPPKGTKDKHPAIVVIQEWWGLNDWVKQAADHFAEQGYVVLAVDLYRGKSTSDAGEAHELMRGLPEDRGLADLEAGFEFLAKRMDVDPAKIGAVGWCMGGGYAVNLAAHEPKLEAVAVNYGHVITDKAAIDKLHASLLGNFGGKDRGIPPEDVKEFEKALRAAQKDVDVKIYDADGHAFMNPANKEGYDAAAADDAWKRIDAFFAKKLKG